MADRIPVVTQYGPGAVFCGRSSIGCAVAATASFVLRYGGAIPRVGGRQADLKALGASMANRHRARDASTPHGRCPRAWCAFCGYLELKSRSVPAAYGRLTWAQIVAHAGRDEPVMLPISYGVIPLVSAASYDRDRPARGRSDRGLVTAHMVVLHGIRGDTALVADSDFGSPARPRVPSHSEIPLDTLERAWVTLGRWKVTYAVQAPDAAEPGDPDAEAPASGEPSTPGPAAPARDGTTFRFGGGRHWRGRFEVAVPPGRHANLRSSPHIRDDNIIRMLDPGTTFACAQTSLAGTNVNGSPRWHGTRDGRQWLHASVVRVVGHRNGSEEIR